jgi:hypothetical protein
MDKDSRKKFHVITMISNPVRYKSRYALYEKFALEMERSGVQLWTAEIAFGDRPHLITESGNPKHLQLRTWDEIWHKENALNLMAQRLPRDWEYLAWIDADISFFPSSSIGNSTSRNWVDETVHQLQHYQIVQMFQQAIDIGPSGETMNVHQGFVYSYLTGRPRGSGYPHWHPGYAWAIRREAFDYLGGLYDVSVLGSGDHLMANALLGDGVKQLPDSMTAGYKESMKLWEDRALKFIKRDIGFVPGTILHHFHGAKRNRFYRSRWEILSKFNFDPEFDLKRDWQGLYQLEVLEERQVGLRDAIRAYFRSRNEDGIDLE